MKPITSVGVSGILSSSAIAAEFHVSAVGSDTSDGSKSESLRQTAVDQYRADYGL